MNFTGENIPVCFTYRALLSHRVMHINVHHHMKPMNFLKGSMAGIVPYMDGSLRFTLCWLQSQKMAANLGFILILNLTSQLEKFSKYFLLTDYNTSWPETTFLLQQTKASVFLSVANFYFPSLKFSWSTILIVDYCDIWTSVIMDGKLTTDHMPQMK